MSSLFKRSKSVQTVFFDIGGVVVEAPMRGYAKLATDIFGCDGAALAQATAEALGPLEKGEITSEVYWERVSAAVAAAGGRPIPAWKFKGFWEGLLSDDLEVDRELIDLVRRLKAHVRVAVLSNVIKEHALILQKQKVYEHFNPVILSCNVGCRKPDPEAYLKAAEMARTAPERCLLVDDSAENLQAAEKVGFRTLRYTSLDGLRREFHSLGFLDHA